MKKYLRRLWLHAWAHNTDNILDLLVPVSVKGQKRCRFFFVQPRKLFRHPLTGLGMLFLKTSEFAAGGAGYVYGKVRRG